jgi:hypothetical protein
VAYKSVVPSNTTIGTADRWQKRTGNEIEPPSHYVRPGECALRWASVRECPLKKILLAECRFRSEPFVEGVRGGRRRPPGQGRHGMTRYLISFGAHAMDHIPDEDMPAVAEASVAVV